MTLCLSFVLAGVTSDALPYPVLVLASFAEFALAVATAGLLLCTVIVLASCAPLALAMVISAVVTVTAGVLHYNMVALASCEAFASALITAGTLPYIVILHHSWIHHQFQILFQSFLVVAIACYWDQLRKLGVTTCTSV